MIVVLFVISNIFLIGSVLLSSEQQDWRPKKPYEIQLEESERSLFQQDMNSQLMALNDYLPLHGMDGFIWNRTEACTRMEGLIRDAEQWCRNQKISTPLLSEQEIIRHISPRKGCSLTNPRTKEWFQKFTDFLIEVKHPEGEMLQYYIQQMPLSK